MEDLALTPSAAAFLQPEVENRLRRVISLAASYAHHRHGKAVRAADIKRAASIITPSSCATLAAIWQGAAQTPTPSAEQQDQVAISQASAELLPSLAQLARLSVSLSSRSLTSAAGGKEPLQMLQLIQSSLRQHDAGMAAAVLQSLVSKSAAAEAALAQSGLSRGLHGHLAIGQRSAIRSFTPAVVSLLMHEQECSVVEGGDVEWHFSILQLVSYMVRERGVPIEGHLDGLLALVTTALIHKEGTPHTTAAAGGGGGSSSGSRAPPGGDKSRHGTTPPSPPSPHANQLRLRSYAASLLHLLVRRSGEFAAQVGLQVAAVLVQALCSDSDNGGGSGDESGSHMSGRSGSTLSAPTPSASVFGGIIGLAALGAMVSTVVMTPIALRLARQWDEQLNTHTMKGSHTHASAVGSSPWFFPTFGALQLLVSAGSNLTACGNADVKLKAMTCHDRRHTGATGHPHVPPNITPGSIVIQLVTLPPGVTQRVPPLAPPQPIDASLTPTQAVQVAPAVTAADVASEATEGEGGERPDPDPTVATGESGSGAGVAAAAGKRRGRKKMNDAADGGLDTDTAPTPLASAGGGGAASKRPRPGAGVTVTTGGDESADESAPAPRPKRARKGGAGGTSAETPTATPSRAGGGGDAFDTDARAASGTTTTTAAGALTVTTGGGGAGGKPHSSSEAALRTVPAAIETSTISAGDTTPTTAPVLTAAHFIRYRGYHATARPAPTPNTTSSLSDTISALADTATVELADAGGGGSASSESNGTNACVAAAVSSVVSASWNKGQWRTPTGRLAVEDIDTGELALYLCRPNALDIVFL